MKRSLFVLLVLPLCLASMGFASADSAATLSAQAAPIQPFNLPIIVHLSLKNTGQEPFSYISGGPGQYPGAQLFYATLKGASGKVYRTRMMDDVPTYSYTTSNMPPGNFVAIYNGQYWRMLLDCITIPIKPGETVDVPIALSPMPLGKYVITFSSEDSLFSHLADQYWPALKAAPISVTVADDSVLASSDAASLWRQANARDPFAQSVCRYFYIPRPKAVATKPK